MRECGVKQGRGEGERARTLAWTKKDITKQHVHRGWLIERKKGPLCRGCTVTIAQGHQLWVSFRVCLLPRVSSMTRYELPPRHPKAQEHNKGTDEKPSLDLQEEMAHW